MTSLPNGDPSVIWTRHRELSVSNISQLLMRRLVIDKEEPDLICVFNTEDELAVGGSGEEIAKKGSPQ